MVHIMVGRLQMGFRHVVFLGYNGNNHGYM